MGYDSGKEEREEKKDGEKKGRMGAVNLRLALCFALL